MPWTDAARLLWVIGTIFARSVVPAVNRTRASRSDNSRAAPDTSATSPVSSMTAAVPARETSTRTGHTGTGNTASTTDGPTRAARAPNP